MLLRLGGATHLACYFSILQCCFQFFPFTAMFRWLDSVLSFSGYDLSVYALMVDPILLVWRKFLFLLSDSFFLGMHFIFPCARFYFLVRDCGSFS